MRGQSGSGSWAVGLNGIAFVEESFVVKLLQNPPNRFHVFGVVGNVRVLHVNPIAHGIGQLLPLPGKTHHRFSAGGVVVFDADGFTYVFFGQVQLFFHLQFNGQAMGIPAGLAQHPKSLHGFVAAYGIFDGTRHNMVYAGHAVGRWRPLKKSEISPGFIQRCLKCILLIPVRLNLCLNLRQVQT